MTDSTFAKADEYGTLDDVRRALTELPELAALLPTALVTRVPGGTAVRSTPGSRPPVRLDVLTLLDDRERYVARAEWLDPDRAGILPYLDTWCRDIEADALDAGLTPEPLPDPATVSGDCAWLLAMLDFAATLPQWPEMADGITITHRRARAATRGVRDDDPAQPVICNRCGEGRLEAVGLQWACTWCEREVTVQAVTLRQGHEITGVKLRTLQRWAWRGLLTPVTDDTGRKLYDLGDIRRVKAEVALRRQEVG